MEFHKWFTEVKDHNVNTENAKYSAAEPSSFLYYNMTVRKSF